MSDTLRNPQNGGINPKPVSNYQSILSKNAPSNGQKNIYRNNNNNPVAIPPGTYIPFAERVEQSPYLISLEQKNTKNNKKKTKKKLIHMYQTKINYLYLNLNVFIKV